MNFSVYRFLPHNTIYIRTFGIWIGLKPCNAQQIYRSLRDLLGIGREGKASLTQVLTFFPRTLPLMYRTLPSPLKEPNTPGRGLCRSSSFFGGEGGGEKINKKKKRKGEKIKRKKKKEKRIIKENIIIKRNSWLSPKQKKIMHQYKCDR